MIEAMIESNKHIIIDLLIKEIEENEKLREIIRGVLRE